MRNVSFATATQDGTSKTTGGAIKRRLRRGTTTTVAIGPIEALEREKELKASRIIDNFRDNREISQVSNENKLIINVEEELSDDNE